MLRALWFLIKAGTFLFALAWLASQPGQIKIEWLGYIIETTVGFAIAALLVVVALWTLIYRLWRSIIELPVVYRRFAITKRREKGYQAVTSGLVAIAAGDLAMAETYLRRARDMVPDTALTKLLSAQTNLLAGNTPKARRDFMELMDDNNAAFFGLRGLLTQALRDGHYGEALELAHKAEELQPKRLWIIRTVYDLETRNREWTRALVTLKKAEKNSVFDKLRANQERQALFTADAMEKYEAGHVKQALSSAEKAFVINTGFAPAALLLARLALELDKKKLAIKTIEKSWAVNPHSDMAAIWLSIAPASKKSVTSYDQAQKIYNWMQELAEQNPTHRETHRMLGETALKASLWKEARQHLTAAADYRLLAKLEIDESRNEAKARHWLEMAGDAQPDFAWVCTSCGHVSRQWQPLCPHCGLFNSQEWMNPTMQDMHRRPPAYLAEFKDDLIAPPIWEE